MNNNFLTKRHQLTESIGITSLYEYIDQLLLYAGIHTIGNKISSYELLKKQ